MPRTVHGYPLRPPQVRAVRRAVRRFGFWWLCRKLRTHSVVLREATRGVRDLDPERQRVVQALLDRIGSKGWPAEVADRDTNAIPDPHIR